MLRRVDNYTCKSGPLSRKEITKNSSTDFGSEQDCIPVGCIPPACWPYLPACTAPWRSALPVGSALPGGSALPEWGFLARGTCLARGCLCQGSGLLIRGLSLPGGLLARKGLLARGFCFARDGRSPCQGVSLPGSYFSKIDLY